MEIKPRVTVIKVTKQDDLEILFEIRRKVFVEEQRVSEKEEYDQYESIAFHYMACLNGVPVGTARWRKTDDGIKLERFAVLIDFRSAGIGSSLLKQILEDIGNQNTVLYLHAQITAIGLYKKFGFKEEGGMFKEAGILHYKMTRKPNYSL